MGKNFWVDPALDTLEAQRSFIAELRQWGNEHGDSFEPLDPLMEMEPIIHRLLQIAESALRPEPRLTNQYGIV